MVVSPFSNFLLYVVECSKHEVCHLISTYESHILLFQVYGMEHNQDAKTIKFQSEDSLSLLSDHVVCQVNIEWLIYLEHIL